MDDMVHDPMASLMFHVRHGVPPAWFRSSRTGSGPLAPNLTQGVDQILQRKASGLLQAHQLEGSHELGFHKNKRNPAIAAEVKTIADSLPPTELRADPRPNKSYSTPED